MTKKSKRGYSILVIAGFGVWFDGNPRVSKIETHVQPIADAAENVDFVCTGPTSNQTSGITYHQISPTQWKILNLLKQFLVALMLSLRNDYDLIVSFSLIPYGLFTLISGTISRTPVHLGIIGSDLDVHAKGMYGSVIQWLFRRFDIITVAGEEFKERVIEYGIDPERVYTVLHPVSAEFAETEVNDNPTYDVLWLTRMSSVKDPHLFVDVLFELDRRGINPRTALVGSGPLLEEIRASVEREGLQDQVDVPGWSDTPVDYYRDSRIYVLTSEREMLPLTLVEAMLVGVPPVIPIIGAIPDVVEDGENGLLVEERDAEAYADAIECLLTSEGLHHDIASSAPKIKSELSYEAVAKSWQDIFESVN